MFLIKSYTGLLVSTKNNYFSVFLAFSPISGWKLKVAVYIKKIVLVNWQPGIVSDFLFPQQKIGYLTKTAPPPVFEAFLQGFLEKEEAF